MKPRIVMPLLAALLAGCGGGLYVGIGGGDELPAVNLIVDTSTASQGQALRFAAAATDDDQVMAVRLFRIDPEGGAVFVGIDEQAPYEWNTTVPDNAIRGSKLRYFARVTDSGGQTADSEWVDVTVR